MRDTITFFDVDTAYRKDTKCTVEVNVLWWVHDLKNVKREFEGKGYLDMVDRLSQHMALAVGGVVVSRAREQVESQIGKVEREVKMQVNPLIRPMGVHVEDISIKVVGWTG